MVAAGYEYCQHCEREHWKPRAVLVGGIELCTHSESYRHECEVRWALRLPDKARKPKISKRDYLQMVEDKRGADGRLRLRTEMVRRWEDGQAKKAK